MRALVVLLAVAITLPLAMPGAIAQQAAAQTESQDAWEPWFDEDLTVRLPLSIQEGDAYPDDWDGPRLIVHEVVLNDVLASAGWPTDRGQPVDFTLDRDSLRIVPQGVEDPTPRPMLTWPGPLLSESQQGPTVTVAFLAHEDVDAYHVYFDRVENDGDHEPVPRDPIQEQRILQLLIGPGSGHQLIAPFNTDDGSATLAVGSAHETSIRVEAHNGQRWNLVPCDTDQVTPTAWARCTVQTGGAVHNVRVTADRPVAAYAWQGGNPMIPLAGEQGTPQGETLLAPNVHGPTTVNLLSLDGSCQANIGSQTVNVGSGAPARAEINQDEAIQADCPLLGWIPGHGPTPLPTALGDSMTTAALTAQEPRSHNDCVARQTLTAVGDQGASMTRLDTQDQEEDRRNLNRPADVDPMGADHAAFKAATWTGIANGDKGYLTLSQGALAWPSLWDPMSGVMQLAPTPTGSIGWIGLTGDDCDATTRLATAAFDGIPRVQFAAQGERIAPDTSLSGAVSVSQEITYEDEPSDAGEIPRTGALAETLLRGDLALTAGFLLVDNDGPWVPSSFAAHLEPLPVTEGEADVIGPLFDLELEPPAQTAGPGEVRSFTLIGAGQHVAPTGEVTPLEINLNAETIPRTPNAPDLEHEIGEIQTVLPLEEMEEITALTVTTSSDVPLGTTPTYELTVRGEPVEGGDQIPARATLQVVPDRDINLVFEDGGPFAELTTDDGEASTKLVLTNEGTTQENVELSTVLPGEIPWEVTLNDPLTGEPFPNDIVPHLDPGESAEIDFEVNAPEGASLVADILILAQSTDDATVASEVTARVAHGIDVDVDGAVDPDLVTLQPGESRTVNLTLENQGSEVSVRLGSDTEDAMLLEAPLERVNLGPEGTERANATIPLNLTAARDAPIGTVVVGTLTLEISVGDLEPLEHLLSLRMRVVPMHDVTPMEPLEVLPGIRDEATATVRATGDADENLALSLLSAPRDWTIEHPEQLTIPHNTTAPLVLNVTTPPRTDPGAYAIAFRGLPDDGTDPITFRLDTIVPETPAFNLTLPTPPDLGVGATETYPLTVENRGNAPGEGSISTDASLVDATPRPASITLAPGESQRLDLDITALEMGVEELHITAEPGGQGTIPITVGTVDLRLDLVSVTPSEPQEGERFEGIVTLANDGTVQARDVHVALLSGDERLHHETVNRLDPGTEVNLRLTLNELPTTDDLLLVADPDGVYEHDQPTERQATLSPDEVPTPPIVLTLLLVALLARLRRPMS